MTLRLGRTIRQFGGVTLTTLLLWNSALSRAPLQESTTLRDQVERSYLELLEEPDLMDQVAESDVNRLRKTLESEKRSEQKRLESEEKKLQGELKSLRSRLESLNKSASRDTEEMTQTRREIHCQVLQLEEKIREKQTERKEGIPIVFNNRLAKLELLQRWPQEKDNIEKKIELGQARLRRHGNVEDIGIRVIREGQEKDIAVGERAIREMKAYGLMPPEIEDEKVLGYIRDLGKKIAVNSDLKIPLKIQVLKSEEINAFALPGGFLFINAGLIQEAENETELAGVIAHEIAHATARHGNRLMRKATIASIVYQAAQVAAVIFTGGVASIGTYYALQYGFFGLGLVLNLALLGVSRDFEEEADQLGAQYSWKAGYDPKGFITFFDKMAKEKGYIRSTSFFRTHPPFFNRILSTFSEIAYLPEKAEYQQDSTEFRGVKARVNELMKKVGEEKKDRPTLRRLPQCGPEDFGQGTG